MTKYHRIWQEEQIDYVSSPSMRGSLPSTGSILLPALLPPERSLLMSARVSGRGLPKVSGSLKFAKPG